MKKLFISLFTLNVLFFNFTVNSAMAISGGGGGKEVDEKHKGIALAPKEVHFSFEKINGKFDKHALQRGLQVYRQVCASCHSLDYVKFRNLGDKSGPLYTKKCPEGFPDTVNCSNPNDNPYVKAVAAEYVVVDGPNDDGDMFERDALPSDGFPNPYPNEVVARMANNGALPPDLSLMTKARKHGPQYIYSLLTGYQEVPAFYSDEMNSTLHFNPYFPGWQIAMKAPLEDGLIDYKDEHTPETVEQYAMDLVQFLHWSAEPKLEQRKSIGMSALIYLFFLTVITYLSYRQIWSKVK